MKYIGTAAWNIPKGALGSFPDEGTQLERYSKVFNAVEINTSFYKDHLAKSYSKWANITPDYFRFSVKLNQRFTHICEDASTIDLSTSLENMAYLEDKWSVLLIQFPAGKKFSAINMNKIYKIVRKHFDGMIALEPRNTSWASGESLALMKEYNITKVIADPEKCPGIDAGVDKYYRLHGNPEIYHTCYENNFLANLELEFNREQQDIWCIFNNTASGYATINALAMTHKEEFYGSKVDNKNQLPGSNLMRL